MKDKENKELITHIAETLREHEASYKEGAWERFAAIDKGRRRILPIWYLSGAAAILLLSVSVFLYKRADDKILLPKQMVYEETPLATEKPQNIERKPESVERKSDNKLITKNIERINSSDAGSTEQLTRHTDHDFIVKEEEEEAPPAEHSIMSSVEKADERAVDKGDAAKQQLADASIKKSEKTEEKNNEEALIRMLSQSSQAENVDVNITNNRSIMDRRWDIGVVLAPAVTDQRFNMGGGVAVAYRISKKISVGSGVSVVDLGLRQAAPQPNGNGPSASPAMLNSESPLLSAKSAETKELTSVNTNWLALDVPIDIKYHVSKQFYASAGISFFAVLNENRTNNYTTHTPMNRTVNAEGYTFAQQEFEVKTVSEKSDETPFEGNSYSGFLNFSVGRQVPLSKRVGVSVEPFIKLPIGRLSRQDMNLRYGGVRIITSF